MLLFFLDSEHKDKEKTNKVLSLLQKERDAILWITSLLLLFLFRIYASAFSAGITDTDLLSSLPTLNSTVPSTKAKRV